MKNREESLTFGHYLVAFVDLLGQRDKLKNFHSIPDEENESERREFLALAKETIGAVDDLQQTTRSFFEEWTKIPQAVLSQNIPGLHRFNGATIKFQHFTDGLVIYVPLMENADYLPAKNVFAALATCGMLCLVGLAKEKPVRIGVAIGIAAELRDNELYGKAVVEAYEAESHMAQYPRVLVTNDVVNYLKKKADQVCDENDPACRMQAKSAKECIQMLAPDFDGRFIVNYLGEFFRKDLREFDDLCQMAYRYVTEELTRQQEKQNTKLAFRYSLLHGYFAENLGELKPAKK
jgi:hypothetical protein